jgi:predicted transglutaminase-like cysteine proteinase
MPDPNPDFRHFTKYRDWISREKLEPAAAPFEGDLKQVLTELEANYRKLPYASDKKNYGKDDYWASRQEMAEKGGDCEDFVNAVYADLVNRGYPADKAHNVIGHLPSGEVHSMLQVGDFVLDQRTPGILTPEHLKSMKEAYRINKAGWLAPGEPGAMLNTAR